MDRCGLIPSDLVHVDPPTCPGCAYDKAHHKKWRHRGIWNIKKIHQATSSGQVVSIDQLVSPTLGFFQTHFNLPANNRYIGATIFVDHFSDFTYAHLMIAMNSKSTTESKEAFERLAPSHEVHVQHCHTYILSNTKVFKTSIQKAKQTLSFYGVNTRHQNRKAERRICDVTTSTRTALLNDSHWWPNNIHAFLWSSVIKTYVKLRNNIPSQFIKGGKNGHKKLSDHYVSPPSPNSPRRNQTLENSIHLDSQSTS